MFPCPSCGGGLRFDIASQMLKCDYCDSTFDPAAYEKSRVGKESPVYEAAVFICPTCGGEMITADEAINGFCPYCGGQSYISRKGELEKPAYVIPFKVTKDDCKAAYRKTAFRSVFAPKALRDADALEEFRGIYMPYWFVENTGHGFLETTGKRTYRRGDYRITDNYHVSANVDYHVCDTAYEASASFDDKISDAIAPYDGKDIREFAPGYLTGFYADKADVPVRIFEKEAAEHTAELITDAMKHSGVEADELNENRLRDSINGRGEGLEQKSWASLLPVWFLTWRDKERVAYAVVNGQTGKVCADLPVDMKRYGLFCFLLAIPIFFLLNLFFTPTPLVALRITSIAAAISIIIYNAQLGSIAKRDKALGDEMNARAVGKKKKRKKDGGCLATGSTAMFVIIIPAIVIMLIKGELSVPSFNGLGYFIGVRLAKSIWVDIITAILTVIPFLGILKKRNVLPGKKVVAPALGSLISVAICIVIFRLNVTEDLVYYFAVAAGYIALLVTLLGVLQKYNYLATRPMPQVLRQGGDTSAPEKRSGGGNKKAAEATALALFLLGSAVLGGVSIGEKLPGAVTAA
ncbi:MAG: hypothetical protein ACSW75_01770, partial [Lachnospiraceae bacterium]